MTIRKFFRKLRDEAKDKIARVEDKIARIEVRLAPSKAPSKRPTIKLISTVPYLKYHRGSVKHRNAPDPAEHSALLIRNLDPESPSTESSTRNFELENYLVESLRSDPDAETSSIGSGSTLISFGSFYTAEEFLALGEEDSASTSSSASPSPIMTQDTISASIYTPLERPSTLPARAIETNDADTTIHTPLIPGCWHGASSTPNSLAQTADVSTALPLHPAFRTRNASLLTLRPRTPTEPVLGKRRACATWSMTPHAKHRLGPGNRHLRLAATDLPRLRITPPDSPTPMHSLFPTSIFHSPYPSHYLQALPNHLFRNPSRSIPFSPSFVREDFQFTFTITFTPSSPTSSSSSSDYSSPLSPSDLAAFPLPPIFIPSRALYEKKKKEAERDALGGKSVDGDVDFPPVSPTDFPTPFVPSRAMYEKKKAEMDALGKCLNDDCCVA